MSRLLLRARQKLGKYRIIGRIASGPLAVVYRAYDTMFEAAVIFTAGVCLVLLLRGISFPAGMREEQAG